MKLKGLAIIPSKNLVENIGFREDATHTKRSNEFIESKMKQHFIDEPFSSQANVISNYTYANYYFSLLPEPKSQIDIIWNKVKLKVGRWL